MRRWSPIQAVRPMKPLLVPIFVVLTVVIPTEQFVFAQVHYPYAPVNEVVTIYEMPPYPVSSRVITTIPERVYTNERYTDRQVTVPATYSVEKPMEKPLVLPTLPEPLAPLLPAQDYVEKNVSETIRGQAKTVDELTGYLGSPPPLSQGAVEEGTLDPKLIGTLESTESDLDALAADLEQKSAKADLAGRNTELTDPLGYTVLLIATVITTIGLVYMAFVAYDYRQRWMQSLTMQNNRYLGGGAFDMEMEDTYSSGSVSLPEGFGLSRHSI